MLFYRSYRYTGRENFWIKGVRERPGWVGVGGPGEGVICWLDSTADHDNDACGVRSACAELQPVITVAAAACVSSCAKLYQRSVCCGALLSQQWLPLLHDATLLLMDCRVGVSAGCQQA